MANTTGLKFGGRQKGSLNKTTVEIKDALQSFISNNIDKIQSDFDSLEPKERLIFFEKILPYLITKQTTMIVDANINNSPLIIDWVANIEINENL